MGKSKAVVAGILIVGLLLLASLFLREKPAPSTLPDTPVATEEAIPAPQAQAVEREAEQGVAASDAELALIAALEPGIREHNAQIRAYRTRLQRVRSELRDTLDISETDFFWLKSLTNELQIYPARRRDSEFFRHLENRLNEVPETFMYAIASVISDDGQSDIARRANNFFHTHCFAPDCGSIELSPDPELYEIEIFATPAASAQRFMNLLNSDDVYDAFREWRNRGLPIEDLPQDALPGIAHAELVDAWHRYARITGQAEPEQGAAANPGYTAAGSTQTAPTPSAE